MGKSKDVAKDAAEMNAIQEREEKKRLREEKRKMKEKEKRAAAAAKAAATKDDGDVGTEGASKKRKMSKATRDIRKIKALQKSTKSQIRKLSFERMVRQISALLSGPNEEPFRFSGDALDQIHQTVEMMTDELLRDGHMYVLSRKQTQIKPSDVRLAFYKSIHPRYQGVVSSEIAKIREHVLLAAGGGGKEE